MRHNHRWLGDEKAEIETEGLFVDRPTSLAVSTRRNFLFPRLALVGRENYKCSRVKFGKETSIERTILPQSVIYVISTVRGNSCPHIVLEKKETKIIINVF